MLLNITINRQIRIAAIISSLVNACFTWRSGCDLAGQQNKIKVLSWIRCFNIVQILATNDFKYFSGKIHWYFEDPPTLQSIHQLLRHLWRSFCSPIPSHIDDILPAIFSCYQWVIASLFISCIQWAPAQPPVFGALQVSSIHSKIWDVTEYLRENFLASLPCT